MLRWSLELDSLFPEAVKKIRETPAPIIRNQHFYKTFLEKRLTSQFPDEAAKVLIFALRSDHTLSALVKKWPNCKAALENTRNSGGSPGSLRRIGPPGVRRSEQAACRADRNVNF